MMKKINEQKPQENVMREANAQAEDFMYYSKLLQKPFADLDELRAAEAELKKQEEEKQNAANAKKAAAKIVEDAIKARVEAQLEAKRVKAEAYQAYLEVCEKADKVVEIKAKTEQEALKIFCEQYGSFHSTVKIGDVTYDCNYSTEERVDPFRKLLNLWF
jgi:alpha-mannosidase